MTRALADVLRSLDSEDLEHAAEAASELIGYGAPAVPHLLGALQRGIAPAVTAQALADLAGPTVLEPLVRLLSSDSEDVRFHVADALGELGDERAVGPLLASLEREELVDNLPAYLSALGQLGDERATAALSAYVAHSDTGVAAEAVVALGRIGDPLAIPSIRRALGSDDWKLRETAGDALRRLEPGDTGG